MTKKNLILGGVLIILIALAYVYQVPLKKWQANLGKPKNIFSKIEMAEVNRIEISNNKKIVILEKEDSKWKVGGTKNLFLSETQASTIEKVLNDSQKENLELVSANKDNKKEFDTNGLGVVIKLMDSGKELINFIVGKETNGGNYISQEAIKETYFIKQDLAFFKNEEWGDKIIFNSAKDKITKLRLQYPDRELIFEKKGENWEVIKPTKFNPNQDKVNKILEVMVNLTAVKLPEQTFKGTGLEKHLIIAEADGDGIKNILMVGEKNKEGFYYAKRGDSDIIYLITQAERDALNHKIEDFK